MAKLTIHDLAGGSLAFDLRHLVHLLAPASLAAIWTIRSPVDEAFEATGPGGQRLEELAQASAHISGHELQNIANSTSQVIWGDFIGVSPEKPL